MSPTELVEIQMKGQVMAEKVIFDEEGNVVGKTGEVTYGGPGDLEAILGDEPLTLEEINEKLKTAEFQKECKEADPLLNPLQAWLGAAIREKEAERDA